MSRIEPQPQERKKPAPGYITTFSDMVTLLLTFFVLLLSLGQMQDPELIEIGRESFVKALATFGLRGILQSSRSPDRDHYKILYHEDQVPDETNRAVRTPHRSMEELYQELIDTTEILASTVVGERVTYEPADIAFEPGSSQLDGSAREYLEALIAARRSVLLERDVRIYVVGIAASEKWERQQWELSARRAEAVAEYLRSRVPSELGWKVYSWGAGDGGEWTHPSSGLADKSSEILIAFLRSGE